MTWKLAISLDCCDATLTKLTTLVLPPPNYFLHLENRHSQGYSIDDRVNLVLDSELEASSIAAHQVNTVMERKEVESKPIVKRATNATKRNSHVISSSVFDSLERQRRIFDSMIGPVIAQQLTQIELYVPKVTIADSIFRQLRVLDTIERDLGRVLDSTAVARAIRAISSAVWVNQVAERSAQFQAAVNQLSLSINRELYSARHPLRELAERYDGASSVHDAFCHYGLWPTPSMSEELVAKIVGLYEADAGSGTVHSLVSRYYAKEDWRRLDEILDRCRNNPLFKRRMKIIEEALQAHKEGLYNSSVTVLLVHWEGIAADYVKKHNLLPAVKGNTRQIILAALSDTPYSLLDVRTYAGVGALIAYVEDSMFASVDFDKEHGRLQGENRLVGHAVRHGRQVDFGTRMNSLRLFLIIDFMTLLEN